jgi:transposase
MRPPATARRIDIDGGAWRPGQRYGTVEDLEEWPSKARRSETASFARGLAADQPAMAAAPTEPRANGQTEGQIKRPKTLKRQVYGRAHIDLPGARLVAAS